jgi:type I restriction enzyme S subunit
MKNNDWQSIPFTHAVTVNPSIGLEKGKVYPFVEMAAIDPGTRCVRESEYRVFKSGGTFFAPGDTLMARITPCLENGKIARFRPSIETIFGFGSTEFIVIRGKKGITTDDFAYYLTKWNAFRQFAISQMTGSSGRQRVPAGSLMGFQAHIPPLPVQHRIADILGSLDDKIELNRRMNRTLEKMATAIFKSWFVDFDPVHAKATVRSQHPKWSEERINRAACPNLPDDIAALFPDSFEESELGEIPKGWTVGTLNDLSDINGWTLSKRDHFDEIDYVEISEVMRGEIANITRYARGCEPGRAKRRLRHGDTAISTVRPDRGSYFLCIEPPQNLIASTGFAVLTAKAERWAFVHVLTTRDEFGKELGRLADGGAYPAVRPAVIGARPVIIPAETQIMAAFEKVVQPMLLKTDADRKESRTLAALRDALLPKLLSGEIDLSTVKAVVEEVL